PNNPHYAVLTAEHIGIVPPTAPNQQPLPPSITHGRPGVGIKNAGFGGMVIQQGANYHFSLFANLLTAAPIDIWVALYTQKGILIAENKMSITHHKWQKYQTVLTANQQCDSAQLVITAVQPGQLALDVISLFPERTFNKRPNGLRPDLAQLLADMKPSFIRFPGGSLVHGDGLGNMYRWHNSIGPVEERQAQKNIWGYHQSLGLGYYEYFQLCEDLGAKPVPVLPAAVSCQNSGGTWRIGGTGQQALPLEEMELYIQEILNLVEWANGPASSQWGAKRAAAGHPAPFNLEYIAIGNEDKITPAFEQRFQMIYNAIKKAYPNVIVIGTSGPFNEGEDFDKGWKLINNLQVPLVDEHYYVQPEWLIKNQFRYDKYDRKGAKVYLGEYASWGNKWFNALAEALYMCGLERNGDVVSMASYAPLFAKRNFTQWNTDMIFFDNKSYYLTPNYYVQKLFSTHAGNYYVDKVITPDLQDSLVASSCVFNSNNGTIYIKLANASHSSTNFKINLTAFKNYAGKAYSTTLQSEAQTQNSFENPQAIVPQNDTLTIRKTFTYQAAPMSLTVIQIPAR
ncbi:MAG TPA: alpha-L-arabinofuranosidase C-terminal domain-containing protein, partial [Phnomibacter sp.]|nr:alpha-L-arabinofuranosidase C-terminal domain-containing protein [Phnomibacter sp.]